MYTVYSYTVHVIHVIVFIMREVLASECMIHLY